MPPSQVRLYRERNGLVPLLQWLDRQNRKVQAKCLVAIEQLELHGRELRRPTADFLRDGIYELRVQLQGIQYRILYGFIGKDIVLVTHGIVKKSKVPDKEIDLARKRLQGAKTSPESHIYEEPER